MAIDYEKYIASKGTHYISNSGSDENGKYHGGAAGDQTGKEWQLRSWYNRPWSCVLRHPDPQVRRLIAELGIEGALNNNVGYDQYQRTTYWSALEAAGYRPANITKKCEEDCTGGVAANIKAVGYLVGDTKLQKLSISTYSGNMKANLKAAGFEVLTASKYRTSSAYLLPGDILLYEGHHAATNITRGSKATGDVAPGGNTPTPAPAPATYKLGDRILKKGMTGSDVKEMQSDLILLGYNCGSCGADGDFGSDTKTAVKAFQKANKLDVDGEYGPNTHNAMLAALSASGKKQKNVRIEGGQCWVRATPGTTGKQLGIAKAGSTWPYAGETSADGWLSIKYENQLGWVSGKYGKLVD